MTGDKTPPPALHNLLTIYGRKAVVEALEDTQLQCGTLHVATSNKDSRIMESILNGARRRALPIREHSRQELSRISKNSKQDQGVALDIVCPHFGQLEALQERTQEAPLRILAFDGITNPQNIGMIIRSAVAAGIDAILYPKKGVAALGPLVVKASTGTLFKAPLIRVDTLDSALEQLAKVGVDIAILAGDATQSLFDHQPRRSCVYVLGNETHGVAAETRAKATTVLSIPMENGVESLNVAVAAALVCYASRFNRG